VYLHILKPADSIVVPGKLGGFTPHSLGKTDPLPFVQHEASIELKLPETARSPIDTVVVLSRKVHQNGN
jgi:hypothetical protein